MNTFIFINMNTHQPRKKKKEPRMRTTLELPSEIWRAAKIRALDERSDFRRVVIAALEAYLKGKPRGRAVQ